jgi:phosphohistidine phosphatase SixA
MLLFGHGWLALESKPLLVGHLSLLGFGPVAAPIMGVMEIALAALWVWRPSAGLLAGIAAWKIASESLFVLGGAATLSAQAPGPLTPELVAALRSGGLVVACRHAITSHDREDRMPVNFDDPSTQRVLSPEGEQQAIAIGRSLASLKIRFGRVLASPFQRTRQSAESMGGRVEIDEALSSMTRGRDAELKALLSGPVDTGANRLVVTHQGLLYRVFRTVKMGGIAEGDCLVVKPNERTTSATAIPIRVPAPPDSSPGTSASGSRSSAGRCRRCTGRWGYGRENPGDTSRPGRTRGPSRWSWQCAA